MEEIIRVKNTSYARYEELLLQKDNLEKEAELYNKAYINEFGDLILDVFRKKLECIRKKKTIEYCRKALNHGRTVSENELQEYLATQMSEFEKKLFDMVQEREEARPSDRRTLLAMREIKRLYRQLARQLHPDINPLTEKTPELKDLWHRIVIAYRCNDLEELEELEILAQHYLESKGIASFEVEIPDIDEKIMELEEEIREILENNPYQYRYILEDGGKRLEKENALRKELEEYSGYSDSLDEILNGLLASGIKIRWDYGE